MFFGRKRRGVLYQASSSKSSQLEISKVALLQYIKNLPIREDSVDPFALYKDFRASLWREEFKQEVCIFMLKGSSFCHAIFMPWNAKNLVMKPLNRVSNYPRRYINCLPSIDDLSY